LAFALTSVSAQRASPLRERSNLHAARTGERPGLKDAIASVLRGAAWQRCRTHFIRNLLTKVPKAAHGIVATFVRTIFAQPDAESVRAQHARTVERGGVAAALVGRGAEEASAVCGRSGVVGRTHERARGRHGTDAPRRRSSSPAPMPPGRAWSGLRCDPLRDIRNTGRIAAVIKGGVLYRRSDLERLRGEAREIAARR
jgi:hypothetical protein